MEPMKSTAVMVSTRMKALFACGVFLLMIALFCLNFGTCQYDDSSSSLRKRDEINLPRTIETSKPLNAVTDVLSSPTSSSSTTNCQIIFMAGVEGSQHHGVGDLLSQFAEHQVDGNGNPFKVHFRDDTFRSILEDHSHGVSDTHRAKVMSQLCPPNSNERHVIFEDISFPNGPRDRKRWKHMQVDEIVSDLVATPRPIDLRHFVRTMTDFADVKILVLHRPYINAVISRGVWDGGVTRHAQVIRANLMYLSAIFANTETVEGAPWMRLCADMLRNHKNDSSDSPKQQRERVFQDLASFLGWGRADCPTCFDSWRQSSKDPEDQVGVTTVELLQSERKKLLGLWPPRKTGEDTSQELHGCPL